MARREENYAIAKSVIPFTKIITSENSVGSLGYDGQGNFIAPISGLYIFHVHVLLHFRFYLSLSGVRTDKIKQCSFAEQKIFCLVDGVLRQFWLPFLDEAATF